MAAQIIQTLLLRKTENKIKTTKLVAQMVQALPLRKTERNLKTVKLAAQLVQKLLLRKTKKLMSNKVASSQMMNLRWIPHLAAIPKWGQERLGGRLHLIMLILVLFHPKHTHLLARVCHQRVKREKGCRVKGTFIKVSGFKLMNSLRYYMLLYMMKKHWTPCLCCPQKLFTEKQFSSRKMKLQQKRSAFPREMKIHVSSVLFSSLPCQRVRGLNLVIFFFLFDLTYFQANSFIVRLLEP